MLYTERSCLSRSNMYALRTASPDLEMPTKLKRISVALDDDAYRRLEELALSSKRSVANMAAVILDAALFPGGRVVTPKEERRGGKRSGAGRKPKINQDGDSIQPQEPETEGGEN